MTHLVQVRHYVLKPESAEAPHEDIAHEAMEMAKGGHQIHLMLPDTSEPVVIEPHDAHHEIVAKVKDAKGPADDTMSSTDKPKRGRSAPPASLV